MGSDDTARRAKDMSIVLDALTLWLKAEGAAGHRSGISVHTEELMNLMGSQFGLNSVDHHLLNISIKLVAGAGNFDNVLLAVTYSPVARSKGQWIGHSAGRLVGDPVSPSTFGFIQRGIQGIDEGPR